MCVCVCVSATSCDNQIKFTDFSLSTAVIFYILTRLILQLIRCEICTVIARVRIIIIPLTNWPTVRMQLCML